MSVPKDYVMAERYAPPPELLSLVRAEGSKWEFRQMQTFWWAQHKRPDIIVCRWEGEGLCLTIADHWERDPPDLMDQIAAAFF